MTPDEVLAEMQRQLDEYREHSIMLNAVATRIGEALGYPPNFEADPLELVEQLLRRELQPVMRVEEIPRYAQYAVVVRGRWRYLVKMAVASTARFHTDYGNGFENPPTRETFTLEGVVAEKRILRDYEDPGTRAHLAPTHPTKSVTIAGEWPATPEDTP